MSLAEQLFHADVAPDVFVKFLDNFRFRCTCGCDHVTLIELHDGKVWPCDHPCPCPKYVLHTIFVDTVKVPEKWKGEVEYFSYIDHPDWKKKANKRRAEAGMRCQVSNHSVWETASLDVHHRTYERLGREESNDLTVLCRRCHEVYEKNKLLPKYTGFHRGRSFVLKTKAIENNTMDLMVLLPILIKVTRNAIEDIGAADTHDQIRIFRNLCECLFKKLKEANSPSVRLRPLVRIPLSSMTSEMST